MNKRMQQEYKHRRVLKQQGWDVSKRDSVAFNSGTESASHFFAKCAVAYVLKQDGYRVSSEVQGPTGEIDVVGYGTDDEPVAIEVETNVSDEVVKDKLSRYVHNQPCRDLFILPVDDMPMEIDEAIEWVQDQL